MIRPVTCPATINYFVNHPDNTDGVLLDMKGAINPKTAFYMGEHGGFAFEWTAPMTFEVHAMVAKAGRGRWALDGLAYALHDMRGLANHFWARVHPDALHIGLFARQAGFALEPTMALAPWRVFSRRT